MKSKKYVTGGATKSTVRPVQGAPKPKPLTPPGAKKPVGPPYAKPVTKPTPKPVAKTPVKPTPKPVVKTPVKPTTKTVISSKGKTVYNPKAGTKTVYDSKGKTVTNSKGGMKTVYNKQGKTETFDDGQKTVYNKQGKTTTFADGFTEIKDKQGSRLITTPKPGTGTKPAATTKPGTGKPTPKPTPKTAVKKPATTTYGPKTTAVLDYMKPSNTLATKPKPVTPAKPATKPAAPVAKTVSQLWTEKTGTSWSEAKKQGLSDGSAKSNMEIMKKLQSGAINKDTIATMKDNSKVPTLSAKDTKVTKSSPIATTTPEKPEAKPTVKQMSGSGMGAMERMEGSYKRGGMVKKKMKSKKK